MYKYWRDWRKSALRAWLILYARVRVQSDHLYGIETSVKCCYDLTAYLLGCCFVRIVRWQPLLLQTAAC
jgi:hypothetical protein